MKVKFIKLFAVLVSCALMLCYVMENSPVSRAYITVGYRWRSSTVKYYYDNFNSNRGKTFLRQGIKAWNDRTDDVNLVAGSASDYDIYCAETSQINVGWDGITYYQTSGAYFTSAVVYLNTEEGWTWTDDGALLSVSVHEFGHALGLAHVQGAVIMNPSTWGTDSRYEEYNLTMPQADDINGVNSIY